MGEAIAMGTNFFWREKPCDGCGRFDEMHVGKRSAGWSFAFRAHEGVRSRADWVALAAKGAGALVDEYGREYPEPVAWLDALQPPDVTAIRWEDGQTAHCALWYGSRPGEWRDAEGFRFYDHEFS